MGMPVTVYWVEPLPLTGMVTFVAEIANSGAPNAEALAPMNPRHTTRAIRKEKGRSRSCMTDSFLQGRMNPV
jgi:hypothetical protein